MTLAGLAALDLWGSIPWRTSADTDLVVVDSAQISPDGQAIAFTRTHQRLAGGKPTPMPASLWRVSFSGGEPQRLTATAAEDSLPSWSPDGRLIAYLSRRLSAGAKARVLVLPAKGGKEQALTDEATDVLTFAWSPGGRRIAYLSSTREVGVGRPRPGRLWILDVSSRKTERLVSLRDWWAWDFAWSPAGTALAAAIAESPDAETRRIAVLPLSGARRDLATVVCSTSQVAWSRDERTIAWLGAVDHDCSRAGRVFVIPASGGSERSLAAVREETALNLFWRTDGRLALAVASGAQTWIDLLDPFTGTRTTVLPQGIASIVSPPSWSADGSRYAVAGSTPEHPAEVFAGSLPPPIPKEPDWVGAPPPPVRRITFSNPQ